MQASVEVGQNPLVVRCWIEVEADGDEDAVQAVVTGAVDALMGLLVDDPAIVDPAVTVTLRVPEAEEVQIAL